MATSIRAAKNLPNGHILTEEDIIFRAPDDGLALMSYTILLEKN